MSSRTSIALGAVLALVLGGPAAAGYVGAAAVRNFDQVTVVYPAGPGEDAAANRRSAERRAAFFEVRHEIPAAISADDAVTERQLQGNLVLLGWSNRLWTTADVPSPFQRTNDDSWTFVGMPVRADEDLLMIYPSPFNPQKQLAFWSRIDPELDRLLPFPFVGSDWVIFRDYFHRAQGMFKRSQDWPPVPNEYAQGEHSVYLPPARERSDHYTLHYEPGQLNGEDARQVLDAREQALAEAIALVGRPADKLSVDLYVYRDQEHKMERTGVADAVHSIPRDGTLFMIDGQARSPSPHEEIHLVAFHTIGPCSITALLEGFAVSLEASRRPLDLEVYAALFEARGVTPELGQLLNEERLRVLTQQRLGFPAAALFVRWMRDRNEKAFRTAYIRDSLQPSELADLLDMPAKQVEQSFHGWIAERAELGAEELAFRGHLEAARQARRLGNQAGLADALARALGIKPDHVEVRYRLAVAELRIGSYDAAENRLLELARLEPSAENDGYRAFSVYQLGRIYDVQGRRDEALEMYGQVLELPEHRESHRLAREAMANPVTEDQL